MNSGFRKKKAIEGGRKQLFLTAPSSFQFFFWFGENEDG
jgi:hypothetical protein